MYQSDIYEPFIDISLVSKQFQITERDKISGKMSKSYTIRSYQLEENMEWLWCMDSATTSISLKLSEKFNDFNQSILLAIPAMQDSN